MTYTWSDLHVDGISIPGFDRRMDQTAMVAYAAATWDWHRLHYDDELAKSLGFAAPIVDGQVFGALMAECVQDWLGPDVALRTLSFRFKTPVTAGTTVRCDGQTVASDGEDVRCALTVSILDEGGNPIAVAATGEATVVQR